MRFPRLIFAFAAQSAAEFRASRGTHLDHTTEEVFWAGLASSMKRIIAALLLFLLFSSLLYFLLQHAVR
jgi:hypothetical protein